MKMRLRPPTPQSTFDTVARRYDWLNACLSLGLDRWWRRRTVQRLNLSPGARILDIATGTAQLALAAAALVPSGAHIVGCDRNERMLRVGQERIRAARPKAPVDLLRCMAEAMPLRDSAFDGALIAFAIDDMEDRHACAGEIFRVLKPGGQLVLLELSLPDFPLLLGLYRIYLRLFPLIGRLFSRGSYEHLREEILAYRGRLAIKELLSETGFVEYRWEGLSGGIVTVHVAWKPDQKKAPEGR